MREICWVLKIFICLLLKFLVVMKLRRNELVQRLDKTWRFIVAEFEVKEAP